MGQTKKTGASKGASAPSEPKKTGPVILSDGKTEAHMGAVRAALAVYAPDESIPSDDHAAVGMLRNAIGRALPSTPEDDKMLCEAVCNEVGTAAVDYCPYCGDAYDAEKHGGGPASGVVPKPPSEAPPAQQAMDTAKGRTKARPPGAKSDALAKVPAAAIATTTEVGIAEQTAELAAVKARVDTLKMDLVSNAWELGVELKRIRDEELWKASGQKTMRAYCESELGLSSTSTYRYLKIVDTFSKETFLEVGIRKLATIAMLDEEERAGALEAATGGASARDLERESKGERSTPPKPERDKGRQAKDVDDALSSKSKPKPNEITLLTKIDAKPETLEWRNPETGRKLAKWRDGAYAEQQIAEDVVLRIALKTDKEGTILGVTTRFVRAK